MVRSFKRTEPKKSSKKGEKDDQYSGAKKKNGFNVLIFVDLDGRVIHTSDPTPGAASDQKIWNEQNMRYLFEGTRYGLLGDAGFHFNAKDAGPSIHGKTPIVSRKRKDKQGLTDEEKKYNKALSHERVLVENVIGRLKAWQFLRGLNRHYKAKLKTEKVDHNSLGVELAFDIICCIHNIDVKYRPLRDDSQIQ